MTSEIIQRQIKRLLAEAEEAIEKFDWETVHQRARTVIGLAPDNVDGVALLDAANRMLSDIEPTTSSVPPSVISTLQSQSTAEQPTLSSSQIF